MDTVLLEGHPAHDAPGDSSGFAKFDWHIWPALGLTACRCRFSVARFHDGLFERFGIQASPRLGGAVKKRRAEYLAGRLCAARALERLGRRQQVPTAADRSPIWPRGTVGSISHCDETAMAAVTGTGRLAGIGIDIERRTACQNLGQAAKAFASEDERHVMQGAGLACAHHDVLAFSMKESFFKAAYPEVGRCFGFSAVMIVEVDPVHRTVMLEVTETLSETLTTGYRAKGAFTDLREYMVTTAVVRPVRERPLAGSGVTGAVAPGV